MLKINKLIIAFLSLSIFISINNIYGNEDDFSFELIKDDFNEGTYRLIKSSITTGKVVIPSTYNGIPVTEIGNIITNNSRDAVFAYSNITSIIIPDSIVSISMFAFNSCRYLTSIDIPSSVSIIGSDAFSNCSSLTSINVHRDNKYYSSKNGILYNKEGNTILTVPSGINGHFSIPDTVESISIAAFISCRISSIFIPENMSTILYSVRLDNINYSTRRNSNPFSSCVNLVSIKVDINNKYFSSENDMLFDKNKTTLITVPVKKSGKIIIPNGVTTIRSNAFRDCKDISSITIPTSVIIIESVAFSRCNVPLLIIPSSITSIADSAFQSWTASQKLFIYGHSNQDAADNAWGVNWRVGCNANIIYGSE